MSVDSIAIGPAGEHAIEEAARRKRGVRAGPKAGRGVVDHRGVKSANFVQRLGVLLARRRVDVVGAEQREAELGGKVVPELLELDRAEHVARLPQQGDHLAVGLDPASGLRRLPDERSNHVPKAVGIDLSLVDEPAERLGCVEPDD